jgi:hypothetical protein
MAGLSASGLKTQETINAPAGAVFIRGIQVYDSTSASTGANRWLEKKDVTYLQEYIPSTESAKRGQPKYYAMFGGATGESDTTSGRIFVAPVPDATYKFRVHYNAAPALLENDDTNYISLNFPNGLLYCCLSETYSFLKGPVNKKYRSLLMSKLVEDEEMTTQMALFVYQ